MESGSAAEEISGINSYYTNLVDDYIKLLNITEESESKITNNQPNKIVDKCGNYILKNILLLLHSHLTQLPIDELAKLINKLDSLNNEMNDKIEKMKNLKQKNTSAEI